jgi:hypothetical protein
VWSQKLWGNITLDKRIRGCQPCNVIQAKNNLRNYSAAVSARDRALRRHKVIEFLIAVSETDPVVLASSGRPGDVLNFVVDLAQWGLGVALIDTTALASEIRLHPKRTLGKLIEDTKRLLAARADGGEFRLRLPKQGELKFNAGVTRQTEKALDVPAPTAYRHSSLVPMVLTLDVPQGASLAAQLEVFIFNAMRDLDSEEGAMVRRCQREACHRIFQANRPKQMFCTRKCQNAVTFGRHSQKPGYVEKHRKAARESARQRREKERKRVRLQELLKSRGKTNG